MRVFAAEVQELLTPALADERLAALAQPLAKEAQRLSQTTMELGAAAMADNEVIGAVSSAYLNQFALVTLGYIWLRMAKQVVDLPEDDAVRRSKLQQARFYMEVVLPEAGTFAKRVKVGKGPVTEIDVELL